MTVVFAVVVALHAAHSIVEGFRRGSEPRSRVSRQVGAINQTILFGLAFYLAWRWGVFSRDLLSPVYIGLGLVAGHLIFGLSLLMIYRSVEDATSYFVDFGGLWDFLVEHPYVTSRFILVGVTEEIVWRAVAQPIVGEWLAPGGGAIGAMAGVGIVAILFAIVHDHFFRNSFVVSLEFLFFSLALGLLYYWSGSLILVIFIHALRDIEICHLEYIVKVHEYGDEAKAAKEIETMYWRPASGSVK